MRRKPGALLPIEVALCRAAADLRRDGIAEFHGFLIAKALGTAADSRQLTGYGTLYRALGRLEGIGLVTSRWEDPNAAAEESRPRRRLYALTAAGERAVASAAAEASARRPRRRRERLAPA
jgi:DNA-binding PadR family transcriptional regulator